MWIPILGFCLMILAVKSHSESPCKNIVQCHCGSSNITKKFCNDNLSPAETICKRLSRCAECKDNVRRCISCPVGYSGRLCFKKLKRIERQAGNPNNRRNETRNQVNSLTYCKDPGVSEHSERNIKEPENERGFVQGTLLTYSCKEGYKLKGRGKLFCLLSGKWSSETPTCLSVNATGCGRSLVRTLSRVHHGIRPEPGEWPWVVALKYHEDGIEYMACGGALISPNHVLTAAHCTVAETFTLYFGKVFVDDNKEDPDLVVRISDSIINHPDYNRANFDADLSIIKFSPAVKYTDKIRPICLPTEETTSRNLMSGRFGYVAGWGVNENNVQASELMYVYMPVLSNADCLDSFRKQNMNMPINKYKYCAGFKEGGMVVCTGDSGSPMMFDDMDETYTIQGIVSFMAAGACGLRERYSLFTNVYEFIDWINENLKG